MSSKYSVKQSVATMATLCLITEFSLAEVNCQNGLDYKNSCNPYKIKFIKVPKSPAGDPLTYTTSSKTQPYKRQHHETRSYLDTLLARYSSNYNGEYGLQSLIDRSGYKSLESKETKEEKVVKTTTPKPIKSTEVQTTKRNEPKVEQKVVVKKEKPKTQEPKKVKIIKEAPQKVVVTTKPKEEHKETLVKKEKSIPKKVAKQKKEIIESNKTQIAKVKKKKSISKKSEKENFKLYTIKKGDSLLKIAKKFSIDLKTLKAINSLDKNNTVKIGQKLKLPANKVVEKKLAKTDKKSEVNTNKDYYVVKKGDTLSLIAKKSGVSITRLREINRLSRSSKIKVGEKIYLKPTKLAKRKNRSFDFAKNIKFKKAPSLRFNKKIRVVATAYTSHRNQTDSTPFLAAWNNRIRPGMKIIAVSHDLIKKYGLTNGVKVKIMGLPGYYTVRDKMNKRLRNHIDIYMGVNKRRALKWGRRRIVLYW